MALSTLVGSFAANTSTGNQAVTGVGFQPKIVFFTAAKHTADGNVVDVNLCWGVGISSTARQAGCTSNADTGANTAAWWRDDACIVMIGTDGSAIMNADVVSMDADGFTINWVTAPASAYIVNYYALGGTDITNVACGTYTQNTATGNQSVTGIGFQPDIVHFMQFGRTTAALPFAVTENFESTYLSWGMSSTARHCVAFGNQGSGDYQDRYISASRVAVHYGSGAVADAADLVSLDADGFTVNWVTNGGSARRHGWVAIKGGQHKLAQVTQKTSTGSQAYTGAGFQPLAITLLTNQHTANDNDSLHARLGVGFGSGASARGYVAAGTQDFGGASDQRLSRTNVIGSLTAGTPTLDAEADLTSLDADGFTLNWGTASASANLINYWAIAANAGGGGDPEGRLVGGKLIRGGLLRRGVLV